MDRGAWWATIHGVTKSQTRLSDYHPHTRIFRYPHLEALPLLELCTSSLRIVHFRIAPLCSVLLLVWKPAIIFLERQEGTGW